MRDGAAATAAHPTTSIAATAAVATVTNDVLVAPSSATEQATNKTHHACEFCGQLFASRNQVFKHLRDAATAESPCGAAMRQKQQQSKSNGDAVDDSAQTPTAATASAAEATAAALLPAAPSAIKKELRKTAATEAKRARRRNKTGQTVQHTQYCLWIGDLPLPWTRHGSNYKRLRALLRAHLPRTIPQPWIKTVQRKAYRTKLVTDATTGETLEGGVYLGFAIVVFRDNLECDQVLSQLNGREISFDSVFSKSDTESNQDFAAMSASGVPSFRIKVRPVENVHQPSQSSVVPTSNSAQSGRDPPLVDQLRPLSIEQLDARTRRFGGNPMALSTDSVEAKGSASMDSSTECLSTSHDEALTRAVEAMSTSKHGRQEAHHNGRLIPNDIRDKLLSILSDLRWAVPNHRPGLTAERYLVLLTNVTKDLFYQDLRDACRQLMDWVDPLFYYSGIAVTKNFVSSPHIDDRDQTFQYALSLGDFTAGGELCVDGFDANGIDTVHVVNTHNRVARIDGRHVHWVRSWQGDGGDVRGGDRYSLIFYDTSSQCPTPVLPMGIDSDYACPVAGDAPGILDVGGT